MSHRAGFVGNDKRFIVAWEGTERECLAYQSGAHMHSIDLYVEVYGPECLCGPDRQPHTSTQPGFLPRSGCLRCDNWDTEPVLAPR